MQGTPKMSSPAKKTKKTDNFDMATKKKPKNEMEVESDVKTNFELISEEDVRENVKIKFIKSSPI